MLSTVIRVQKLYKALKRKTRPENRETYRTWWHPRLAVMASLK